MSLVLLPKDILRHLAIEYLPIKQIFAFRLLCKDIRQSVYMNTTFWWSLIRRRLTNNPKVLAELADKHPRNIIWDFYMNTPGWWQIEYAARDGYEIFVRQEIPNIYKKDDLNCYGVTAVQNGRVEVYHMITQATGFHDYATDIYAAVKSGNVDMVAYIIDRCDKTTQEYPYMLQRVFICSIVNNDRDNRDDFSIPDYLILQGASLKASVHMNPHVGEISPMDAAKWVISPKVVEYLNRKELEFSSLITES